MHLWTGNKKLPRKRISIVTRHIFTRFISPSYLANILVRKNGTQLVDLLASRKRDNT